MQPKPKLIEPVLEAIRKLAERNGSSAKDILNYVLRSDKRMVKRNLTLQVRKALRQAVTQGLVRLRGGRYKTPSCPVKKIIPRTVEKEKNHSATPSKKQARSSKVVKFAKEPIKGRQADSKGHEVKKSRKVKKRSKPPAK